MESHLQTSRTLVLNQGYQPIKIVNWKRAICLFFMNKADVLSTYDREIHTVDNSYRAPAVIRLLNFSRLPRPTPKFSRAAVYARDGHRCQYCGKRFKSSKLTLDHVVPRVKGGTTDWENITTSCQRCNRKKGSRLLREAGMVLRTTPKKPQWNSSSALIGLRNVPAIWRDWIFS